MILSDHIDGEVRSILVGTPASSEPSVLQGAASASIHIRCAIDDAPAAAFVRALVYLVRMSESVADRSASTTVHGSVRGLHLEIHGSVDTVVSTLLAVSTDLHSTLMTRDLVDGALRLATDEVGTARSHSALLLEQCDRTDVPDDIRHRGALSGALLAALRTASVDDIVAPILSGSWGMAAVTVSAAAAAPNRTTHTVLESLLQQTAEILRPLTGPRPTQQVHPPEADRRSAENIGETETLTGRSSVRLHAVSTHVVLGRDEHEASTLVSHALGLGAGSLLNRTLREDSGLCYTVMAASPPLGDVALLDITATTVPDRIREVSAVVRKTVARASAAIGVDDLIAAGARVDCLRRAATDNATTVPTVISGAIDQGIDPVSVWIDAEHDLEAAVRILESYSASPLVTEVIG